MSDEYLKQIIELQREMLTELRLLRQGLFPQAGQAMVSELQASPAASAEPIPPTPPTPPTEPTLPTEPVEQPETGVAAPEDLPAASEGATRDKDGLGRLLTDAEYAVLLDARPEPEPAAKPEAKAARGLRFPGFGGFADTDGEEPVPASGAAASEPAPEPRQPARGREHSAPSEDVDELRGIFDTPKAAPRSRQGGMDRLPDSFGESEQRSRGGARMTTSDLAGELGELLSGLKRRNKERAKSFEEFQGRFGKR